MATDLENLQTTRSNYITQLLELSDPATRKPSYSIGGRSVQWVEYMRFLREQVSEMNKIIGDEDAEFTVTALE